MDLKDILSIGGKPGLYKIITQTRNGWLVESLTDKKRVPIFSHEKVSSLEEISIFTEMSEVALKNVFINMYEHTKGEKAISHKESAQNLRHFFGEVLPDYDEERVYTSDIKKVLSWYNTLIDTNVINAETVETAKNPPQEAPETAEEADTEAEK